MKTARITFLGTPDFKRMLEQEASAKRISIGELIRTRFSSEPTAEERELAQLAALLQSETAVAHAVLTSAIAEAQETLGVLRAAREHREREVA